MKKYLRAVVAVAVLAGMVVNQLGQLTAQSNALAIIPRKDYALEPGESVSDTLTVTNRDTQNPLRLNLTLVDFTSQDETGAPQLLDANTQRTAWSLRGLVDLPQQVEVEPGASVRIPISITMPADVGAGSYYSAIEYTSVTSAQDDSVNISAAGVSLLFVKVPGLATQQLTFEQFGAFVPDSGTGGSFAGLFFSERPKVMAYRLKNDGNIAEQPNASIRILNNSGDVMYTISDANPKQQLALRGQVRRFDACIAPENVQQTADNGTEVNSVVCGDTNFKPGRYVAELTVLYGENGSETREINARATFWYLPWWFLGLIAAGLALLAGVVFYIVRRVQSYRSRKTRRR